MVSPADEGHRGDSAVLGHPAMGSRVAAAGWVGLTAWVRACRMTCRYRRRPARRPTRSTSRPSFASRVTALSLGGLPTEQFPAGASAQSALCRCPWRGR